MLFPPVMLILFGSIFGTGDVGSPGSGVTFPVLHRRHDRDGHLELLFPEPRHQHPAGRDSGALKRLYGTPMLKSAYFVGKILLVGFLSLIEIVGLLAMGVAFYGVSLPPASRLPDTGLGARPRRQCVHPARPRGGRPDA